MAHDDDFDNFLLQMNDEVDDENENSDELMFDSIKVPSMQPGERLHFLEDDDSDYDDVFTKQAAGPDDKRYVPRNRIPVCMYDTRMSNRDVPIPDFTEKCNIKWTRRGQTEKSFNNDEFQTGIETKAVLRPMEYVLRYLPLQFFEEASDMTNRNAVLVGQPLVPTTAKEVRNLFGIHILLGALRYPQISMY